MRFVVVRLFNGVGSWVVNLLTVLLYGFGALWLAIVFWVLGRGGLVLLWVWVWLIISNHAGVDSDVGFVWYWVDGWGMLLEDK